MIGGVKTRPISVVIAVRNEEASIYSCLQHLADQDYPLDQFEIIIIDDHSEDQTGALVKQFIAHHPSLQVRLSVPEHGYSKKKAMESGVRMSRYGIIATTDADCAVPKNWLSTINASLSNEYSMMLGPVLQLPVTGFLGAFQLLDMMAMQGIGFGMLAQQRPVLNNGANLSFRKEAFYEVGGYDDHQTPSGDDVFLLEKFVGKDLKITGTFDRNFLVETKSEPNLKSFFHQRLRWSSKTKYYSNPVLISLGILIILQNLALLFIYTSLVLVEKKDFVWVILLLCKWLIDFILLFLVASRFKRRSILFYFIPVQVIYPCYVVLIWILSQLLRYEWKSRPVHG